MNFGRSESTRRLGWLLRVSRGSRGLREFAAAMGPAAVPSTLSRWERGSTTVTYPAVRGYAAALGRPELLAVADNVARYYGNRLGPSPALARPPLDPAVVSRRLDRLIDRAVGNDLFSGPDWDALTDLLSRGIVVLSPRSTWAVLAERLLSELAIADGAQWLWRAEALHRLLAHPVGGDAAVAAAAAAAADRSAQSLVGTLSVLDATSSPFAAAVVLRHLKNPASDRSFSGALLSCHRKVRLGHFTIEQLAHIGGTLADAREQPLVTAIAARMPLALRKRFALPWRDERSGSAWQQNLIGVAVAAAGGTEPADDPLLVDLLAESLGADVFDERLHALFLLHASPYRAPIARELGQAMAGRHGDTELVSVTGAARNLGGRRERAIMERLVLAASTSPDLREAAAFALGHVGGTSADGFWRAVLAAAGQWRPDASAASVLDRLVYAAGRAGHRRFLQQVFFAVSSPEVARVSARWWLELPPHIRLSAAM